MISKDIVVYTPEEIEEWSEVPLAFITLPKIKPNPPTDTICFHAQQCAEKYLKAYLVYQDIEFIPNNASIT